jgi:tetratricopeptide (TPR) repeat protein
LIVAAAVVAYHNSFSIPLFFDDLPGIERNLSLREPSRWFFPPVDAAGATGRPLVNFTLGLNYAFGQLDVTGYHAVNFALHVLASLTLLGVVRRSLLLPGFARSFGPAGEALAGQATAIAFASALLWSVHPLLTESVNCVIQRNELLVGLFYLLTLYAFIRSVAADGGSRWRVAAIAACFLGVLSKEVMATAPVLVLLYDRMFVAGTFRAAWAARRRFYGALFSSWLLLLLLIAGSAQRTGTVGFGLGMSSWDYLLTQCRAILIYLKLSLWPAPLVVDYGYAVTSEPARVLPQALLLLALAGATIWALVRRHVAGFVGAWFFLILGPSSSVVPLTTQTIAEHRMYLPLAGLVTLAVFGLFRGLGRRGLAVALGVSLVFTGVTVVRNQAYASPLAIWSDTVAKWPDNARARTNLGNALARLGRIPEAIPHYVAAIGLDPTYQEAQTNLGLALLRDGKAAESLTYFAEAVKLRAGDAEAERNWGEALARLDRLPEALAHFRRAAEIDPDHPQNIALLGWALLLSSRTDEAIPILTRAAQLQPDSPDVRVDLANALVLAGRFAESGPHFEAASRLRVGDANIHFNWGQALLRAGRPAEAATQFAEVVRLRPADAEARALLQRTQSGAGAR